MNQRPIRMILVEDSRDDADLLALHLANHDLRSEMRRIDNKDAFLEVLGEGGWDLVISDYLLPETNGMEILGLLRERDPDLPFILLSGVLDEGAAVEAMRNGANDFLLKGNLSRLEPAIEREIREAEVRRQRREGEAELRLLHSAIGQTPDIVIITGKDGTIVYANPAAETTSGYRHEELIGQNPRIFKSGFHDAAYYQSMWEALVRGETWHGQIVNKRKDGTRWDSLAVISPIFDSLGELGNYLLTARDVSHERELENQLEQTQRLETIGVLTSGIAHDFNNILMPIVGHAELGLERRVGDPRIQNDLQVILDSAERAGKLVRQILSFSRSEAKEAAPVEFQILLGEALKLLRATVPTPIAFQADLDAGNPWVAGDPTKLHQVILNLCVNATHAMRGTAGRLSVNLHAAHLEPIQCSMGVSLTEGDYVVLEVRDTGRGIAPEHLDKIFLPFFSTKPAREGTGLGLSVTHAIVSAMGGGIQVESELGKGTSFTVFLPRVAPAEAEAPAKAGPAVHGHAHLLVVDDEEVLLRSLAFGLEALGFKVTACKDPREALLLYEATPDAFDLLLTDLQMPELPGIGLAEAIWAHRSSFPVILITGNALLADEGQPDLGRFQAVLIKPMLVSEVARTVQQALGVYPSQG